MDHTAGPQDEFISKQILKEIQSRLKFLVDVGLEYVTLDRESSTLAGGAAQRLERAVVNGLRVLREKDRTDEAAVEPAHGRTGSPGRGRDKFMGSSPASVSRPRRTPDWLKRLR